MKKNYFYLLFLCLMAACAPACNPHGEEPATDGQPVGTTKVDTAAVVEVSPADTTHK